MRNIFKVFIALLPIFILLAVPLTASAVPLDTITKIATDVGLPKYASFGDFFLDLIKLALAIVFLIAVVFIIIGGYRMITSAGNEETITKAKSTLTWALIGLVVVILAWIITAAITELLSQGSAAAK